MKNFSMGILIGVLSIISAASATEASFNESFKIGFDVDYTMLAMDNVNSELNKGTSVTEVNSAIAPILNFDVALAPFLFIGARTGYLFCMPGKSTYNLLLYNLTSTLHSSFLPLEAGLNIKLQVPATPISINAGIYGGYGFAFASYKNDESLLGQTSTFTQPFNGGGFTGEAIARVNFQSASALSLNVNGGYRLANIEKMEQSKDVRYTDIFGITKSVDEKGAILKDSNNKDLPFDFSGFSIGIGLSLSY